jgi:hypothetical protein
MPTAKCPTFLSWIIQGSVRVNNFGNAKATNNVNAKNIKCIKHRKMFFQMFFAQKNVFSNVFCTGKKGQVKVNA